MKINSSAKMNKDFAARVAIMSITHGLDLHIAKNILRWRRSQRALKASSPVWTDPKTGLALSEEQWNGPALKMAKKVGRMDEESVSLGPDETWAMATARGMVNVRGLLLTRDQFNELALPREVR